MLNIVNDVMKRLSNKTSNSNSNEIVDKKLLLLKKLAEGIEGEEIAILYSISKFDWDELKELFLNYSDLHKKFIKKLYPDYEFLDDIDTITENYDYTYHFNIDVKERKKLKEINSAVLLDKRNGNIVLALLIPVANIPDGLKFNKIAFMSSALHNFFYKNRDIEIDGGIKHNLHDLLQYMEDKRIDDLHIRAIDPNQYIFTARIGAEIQKLVNKPRLKEDVIALIHEAKIEMDEETLEDPPEITGLIKTRVLNSKGISIDRTFRVNIVMTAKGLEETYSLSIRRLMNLEEINMLGLEGLGYLPEAIKLIRNITSYKKGANLVAGETNSGKSTLLAQIMNEFDEKMIRVISIENPTEIVTKYDQIDLSIKKNAKDNVKMTRERAMKALLRHDPDVVLITELRDEEISDFVQLGLRGHAAYATIHANDVVTVLLRLLGETDNPLDVLSTINGIIVQTLVSKKCSKCKGYGKIKDTVCNQCGGKGVYGKVPVCEIAHFKKINLTKMINSEGKVDFTKFFDFKTLIKQGMLDYISKAEVAKKLYEKGIIFKEDYEKIKNTEKNSLMFLEENNVS